MIGCPCSAFSASTCQGRYFLSEHDETRKGKNACYTKGNRKTNNLLVENDLTNSSASINCVYKITYSRKKEIKYTGEGVSVLSPSHISGLYDPSSIS